MYEAHFGLKKPLFQTGIAQESAVFLSARHQQIAMMGVLHRPLVHVVSGAHVVVRPDDEAGPLPP